MRRALLLALAALALVGPSLQAEAGGDATVTMNNLAYDPQVLVVRAGGTVTWVNGDSIEHTVTLDGVWDSGEMWPGDRYARAFDAPGTFPYRCVFHLFMVGAVVVEA
jgi:plastocyanin